MNKYQWISLLKDLLCLPLIGFALLAFAVLGVLIEIKDLKEKL